MPESGESQQVEAWYVASLGDGMTAGLPSEEIRQAVLRLFPAGDAPPRLAVFTRLESEGRLHCEVLAYFSPAAGELARAFGAQPCAKPQRMGLDLLAGNARAWSALFDEDE
jgi:hypothetical protein